jgi:hypothetical protein
MLHEQKQGSLASTYLVSRGEVGTKQKVVAAGGGTKQLCMSQHPGRAFSYRDSQGRVAGRNPYWRL